MKIGIKVGDVMTRNFVSARPDLLVLAAVKLMVKKRVGSLVLEQNGILKGILTEKDIMWALTKKKDLSGVKAGEICTKKITTIKPSADIYDAIILMRKKKFRRLPVTVNKKVIGYLTLKDIIKIQPELFEIAREGYNIKWPIDKEKEKEPEAVKEGMCDECGNYDILYNSDGKLMCESCMEDLR
ncbi:Inosine-5'-monophosphate dehydrogenase [uncultured archaeon]|nr:Inosine-5'-monophosphate dehydrogenase [uncultured archaeon]